jgi:uncharacterized protein YabN with tetrapyrrole methylase and pyrophosphatase domain
MRAEKVGKKASMLDFPTVEDVLAKLDEEIAELKAAVREGGNSEVNEELGDVLLTLSSLSRKLDVDAERALNASTTKFIDRFEKVHTRCSSYLRALPSDRNCTFASREYTPPDVRTIHTHIYRVELFP